MRVILLCVLLLLSVESECEIHKTVYLSRQQTWNDASGDLGCSMLGLDLTGDAEKEIGNISSTVLGTHQTAWIGAHVKRIWINFGGCYYGIFKHNASGIAMTSPGDPAKECLRYCNYSRFVLTGDRCVCYKDVTVTTSGCIAGECYNTKYTYCGKGTAPNSNNISNNCMCQFSVENDSSYISGYGNCLAVIYKPQQQFIARSCNERNRPLCYRSSHTTSVEIILACFDWLHSLSECYKNDLQFVNKSMSFIGQSDRSIYWVGGFAVTYTLWGHPPSTNDRCVAVNITNNHLIPVVLPCGTLLPALCVNTSVSTQVTTELSILGTTSIITTDGVTPTPQTTTELSILGTTSIITTDGVTPNQQITNNIIQDNNSSKQQTTRRGHVVTTHSGLLTTFKESVNNLDLSRSTSPEQSSVPTVVGSVVGGIAVLIIIVVILLLRRRGVFKKFPAAKHSGEGDDIEMRNPDKVDQSYPEVISTPDTVYNHLGELKTKHIVSGEDLYDHTGDQSETYGQLHTHNNKYDDDSEYDHTFNHTARDTYGHLNSAYPRDDDSEYDHTFNHTARDTYGHLNRMYPRDDDSEYDHTFSGISDDTYGRLHAGKRRDSDDVYDHTGGSGNTYAHINISKRAPEVESDYDHTRLS